MSIATLGIHSSVGFVCIQIAGASGNTAEVIVRGQSSSMRFSVPLSHGKGDLCFRVPPGFDEDIVIIGRDGGGSLARTGSVQV